jgi:hypothetical protein
VGFALQPPSKIPKPLASASPVARPRLRADSVAETAVIVGSTASSPAQWTRSRAVRKGVDRGGLLSVAAAEIRSRRAERSACAPARSRPGRLATSLILCRQRLTRRGSQWFAFLLVTLASEASTRTAAAINP